MSKNFMFYFFLTLIFVAVAVVWLLSILMPETAFGEFTLGWAIVAISGAFGIAFVLRGLFKKNVTTLKKWTVWLGCGFFVVTLFALIGELTLPNGIIIPIIAIIIAVGLFLGILATGGKKWDSGDNQKVGYKNYHQRKAEEQKEIDRLRKG
ncbi:MAG: hypothetical protein FWD49_05570 [Firmicutes bacterium]|nr:hypothetical protein [Bacillota bacterium]